MKKYVNLNVDYACGESCYRPGEGCDYMLIDTLPDDAPTDELYVEIDPEEVPGEGHWEGEIEQELEYEGDEFHDPVYREVDNRKWVFDDEWASEPILFQMIAEKAREIGFEVLYCGYDCDCPEDLRKIEYFRPEHSKDRILIVGYDAEEE